MKTIALYISVYLATLVLFWLNMLFVHKWYKCFDPHYAWKEEKLEKNIQSLKKYFNHHIISILILLVGIPPMGIAVWLTHDLSEKTLFILASILFLWNIIGIVLVAGILRDVRKIRKWIKEGQETELKIRKWFDDLKLILEKFKYQLEHRLH